MKENNLFQPLLEAFLEEASYNNPMVPFERYKKDLEQKLSELEKGFTARFERGMKLLVERNKHERF